MRMHCLCKYTKTKVKGGKAIQEIHLVAQSSQTSPAIKRKPAEGLRGAGESSFIHLSPREHSELMMGSLQGHSPKALGINKPSSEEFTLN